MVKKRILIDASTISSKTDGLTIYIINIIKYLPQESFNIFEYWILLHPEIDRSEIEEFKICGKFNFIEYPIAAIGPKRDWDMWLFLRRNRHRFDLIHITSNTYPLFLSEGICTIHDITFKKYFDGSLIYSTMAKFYINQVVKHCLKSSKYVIAVSESTKNQIKKEYKLTNIDKVRVIYEGWEHISNQDRQSRNVQEEIKSPYILYLGTLRKHKNIANLLKAFKIASNKIPSNIKLAISGSNVHMNIDDLEIVAELNKKEERVIFTGYLSDTLLESYYRNAEVFIFPSLAEGFGLPVLEAFYNNCPLICSNTTSFPEIAGDAAIYFNPFNPQDIANAIIRFFNFPEHANKMKMEGTNRLKMFSWKKASQQTVDLYTEYFNLNKLNLKS